MCYISQKGIGSKYDRLQRYLTTAESRRGLRKKKMRRKRYFISDSGIDLVSVHTCFSFIPSPISQM